MKDLHADRADLVPYLKNYVAKARDKDVHTALLSAWERTSALFGAVHEERGGYRYAAGKWSVKEVLQHLNDCERIFSYRALRFARNDATALASFEENDYASASRADRLPLSLILEEHEAIRRSTLALFNGFDTDMLARSGTAGGSMVTVHALGLVIAGHAEHHCDIHEQRYL